MAKIEIKIPSKINSENTFNKIKIFLNSENTFKKFDSQLACSFDDSQNLCSLNGSQFKAEIKVQSLQPEKSLVQIEIELPFSLSLFKGKIKEEVEKAFHKILS